MSKDEAKVKVRLDTRQAKGDLRALTRDAAKTAGRVGQGLRGAVSKGFGAVGVGAGIGTGLAAVKGASASGFGDVIGEAMSPLGAALNELALGDVDDKARASKAAREETIQAFGAIAGQQGAIPAGAQSFFNQVKSLRTNEEVGRSMFERDDRFGGVGVGKLVDKVMSSMAKMMADAVQGLGDRLLGAVGIK